MLLKSSILLQLLINCILLDLAFGLLGRKVRDAQAHEYPYVVSISGKAITNNTDARCFLNLHFCTGTLISHKSVLTAAHCLINKQVNHVEIIAGATNIRKGEKHYPESWITYSEWKHNKKDENSLNDIAVIKLKNEGITNPKILPAVVLIVDNDYLNGKDIKMLGWGEMGNGKHPTALKMATLKVISNADCSHQGTMLKGKNFTVPPNYFCSKAEPWAVSTSGDGGAPILNKNRRLVGINIGVCPKVEGYPEDMLHELQMNSNLNFHYYADFLNQVIQ